MVQDIVVILVIKSGNAEVGGFPEKYITGPDIKFMSNFVEFKFGIGMQGEFRGFEPSQCSID
jgi:hypothetical protein